MTILITIAIYFGLLLLISHLVGKGGNDAFFRGNRQSPWPVVAFGMIGASLSGVTFISVPGMVMNIDMTYLQMCIGFIFGYFLVAVAPSATFTFSSNVSTTLPLAEAPVAPSAGTEETRTGAMPSSTNLAVPVK